MISLRLEADVMCKKIGKSDGSRSWKSSRVVHLVCIDRMADLWFDGFDFVFSSRSFEETFLLRGSLSFLNRFHHFLKGMMVLHQTDTSSINFFVIFFSMLQVSRYISKISRTRKQCVILYHFFSLVCPVLVTYIHLSIYIFSCMVFFFHFFG